MHDLFEQGRWEELESGLRSTLSEDSTDARSAFRLANLLELQDRVVTREEALRWYDVAWAQRWPGAICLNNKGVALARSGRAGEARAACATLKEALAEDPKCAPAAYNLGILTERMGEEGLPRVMLAELGLLQDGIPLSEAIRARYHEAVEGAWRENQSLIDGPFFLWLDDLASGFGFEPTPHEAEIDDGDRYFRDGLAHLDAGEWQAAIDAFAMATSLYPALAARIVPHRVRAQIALAKEFRQKARHLRAAGQYDDARSAAATSYSMAASLPDRTFAEELLLSEIRRLGEELRQAQPSLDWRDLQHLILLARQRVEAAEARNSQSEQPTWNGKEGSRPPVDLGDEGDGAGSSQEADDAIKEEAESETAHRAGAGSRSGGGGSASGVSSDIGRYIQSLCRDAWGQQLHFVIGCGAYDEAELMLDFPEVRWFAQEELPRWRLDLFTSKAKVLAADAMQAATAGKRKDALDFLHEARKAAMEAHDPHLADDLDKRIARLEQRLENPEELAEIRDLLGSGKALEALRRSAARLAEDAEQPAMLSLWETARHRLRVSVGEAVAARQWKAARRLIAAGLEIVSDDSALQDLAREAKEGLLRDLIGQGENDLAERRLTEAREHCERALELDPAYGLALDLRRRIDLAEKVDPDVADEAYDAELVAFQQARAAARPREAYDHLARLRELRPEAPETREAEEWTEEALVRLWRNELERERTPAKAKGLEEELLQRLGPNYQPAVELREELRRATDSHEEDKRGWSLERLAVAKGHLRDRQPAAALKILEDVAELGDPRLAPDLEKYSQEALAQIRRRVERMAREAALDADEESQLQELIRACRRWNPQQAQRLEDMLTRGRQQPELWRQAEDDFEEIRQAVLRERDSLRALRLLHQLVAVKRGEGSEVLETRRDDLRALRNEKWRSLSAFQRWRARGFERRRGVAELSEDASNGAGGKR